MKSYFLWLLILLGVCFFFLNKKDEEIRVRVVSNSNQESDIKYKEEVVLYLKQEILKGNILNEEYFKNNQLNIEEQLNKRFENINVSFQKHTFSDKTYNGSVLESREYDTLLIVIGEGKGSNWWGSIFASTLQKESTDEVIYEWYFNNLKG